MIKNSSLTFNKADKKMEKYEVEEIYNGKIYTKNIEISSLLGLYYLIL